jgi:hypothetical protein
MKTISGIKKGSELPNNLVTTDTEQYITAKKTIQNNFLQFENNQLDQTPAGLFIMSNIDDNPSEEAKLLLINEDNTNKMVLQVAEDSSGSQLIVKAKNININTVDMTPDGQLINIESEEDINIEAPDINLVGDVFINTLPVFPVNKQSKTFQMSWRVTSAVNINVEVQFYKFFDLVFMYFPEMTFSVGGSTGSGAARTTTTTIGNVYPTGFEPGEPIQHVCTVRWRQSTSNINGPVQLQIRNASHFLIFLKSDVVSDTSDWQASDGTLIINAGVFTYRIAT